MLYIVQLPHLQEVPYYLGCSLPPACNILLTQDDNIKIDDQTICSDSFESRVALSRLLIKLANLAPQFAQWRHRCRKFMCAWSSCHVHQNDKQPRINFQQRLARWVKCELLWICTMDIIVFYRDRQTDTHTHYKNTIYITKKIFVTVGRISLTHHTSVWPKLRKDLGSMHQ